MPRTHLALSASLLLVATAACHRTKPEAAPTPATSPVASTPTAKPTSAPTADDPGRAERERAERERAALASARAAIAAPVYFGFDQSDLTDDARRVLEAKVAILTRSGALRLRVEGNADDLGSDEYNLALGQRRAATVRRFLADRGVDASHLDIVSFGEERPVCREEDESCRSKNRRAEFEITSGAISASPE